MGSIMMDADFCVETLNDTLDRFDDLKFSTWIKEPSSHWRRLQKPRQWQA
jgi:hypothetical protein